MGVPGARSSPGEAPEEAAVREALEDTGNKVAAVCIIGEREHPATSVHLVYVACRPPG